MQEMEEPREVWGGLASLDPTGEKYEQIKLLLASADFSHLKHRAVEVRQKLQPEWAADADADAACEIDTAKFASGFNNVVLKVVFSDHVHWAVRIPYEPFDNYKDKVSLLSEIATMKIVKNRTSVPVPQIYDFEPSSDNPLGYPYVLMELLRGRSVPLGLVQSIPEHQHAKVARQLANVFTELQTLTFSRIGRLWCGLDAEQPVEIISMAWHETPGPLDTSLEYFYNQQQGANREILSLHPDDPDWRTACWVLKSALTHIIIEDRVRGPFPLCHLDLHYGNMLLDEDFNLTGIIDWSSAQAAPLEQLSVCPELITFPRLSDEENRPIREFKSLVIGFIKERETAEAEGVKVDCSEESLPVTASATPLSSYMSSNSAQIAHRHYMASPRGSLWAGKMVAGLIYGESVSWEQLKAVYGHLPLC